MSYLSTNEIINRAWKRKFVVPGFNIPYLPMMEPVVKALKDMNTFGLIMVARLEWIKFKAGSLKHLRNEYEKVKDINVTRLHLDHIPVIHEDGLKTDYDKIISEAIGLGYESVMIDASRLPLDENIKCTRSIAEIAHKNNIPVEAELGAIMGHESGPLPSYETLFQTGKGFTSSEEARQFIQETEVDWLSVAIGNIHGAISKAKKDEKKIEAKLNIERLDKINKAINIPIVLHGGTGIRKKYIMESIEHGIAKINIATAIRQPYERGVQKSVERGQEQVYLAMVNIIKNDLEIENTAGEYR